MDIDSKISILLVDDRPENLISLAAILDVSDYHLVKASSGQEALRILLNQEFALILLDVQMPLMDGFETANLIRKREKSKHVPIIFITALSPDAPFLFRGYSVGAVDYIVKPFDPNILRSKVAVFADLYRKAKQLEKQSALLLDHARLEREREIIRIEVASLKREQAINDKYRDLVEGIKDGIVWIADLFTLNFSFISSQVSRFFEEGEDFFQKALISDPFLIEQREKLLNLFKEDQGMSRDFSFEHEIKDHNGKVLWFQTGVRLAESDSLNGFELRGITIDITKIKNAEQEAKQAILVRDQFLSIASHELKTPLTPLCLQFGILQKMTQDKISMEVIGQKLTSSMDRLCRQTDRLSHLIDELLDISRINNGKLLLEKEKFVINEVVQEVSERFQHELNCSGSKLELFLESNVKGFWDRLRIEQIVTNLLTNAIKYGNGGLIKVFLSKENDSVVLKVQDQGIGIKPEDQERIFYLYERAVSPMHFGGLGLGLYIVRQIIEAHEGTITLESEIQKGSTFTVKIPLSGSSRVSPVKKDLGEGLYRDNRTTH